VRESGALRPCEAAAREWKASNALAAIAMKPTRDALMTPGLGMRNSKRGMERTQAFQSLDRCTL
jgi:hypothetical protein